MSGFGKIAEAMQRMKQMRQQPNSSTSPMQPDNKFGQIVSRGRMLGGGGFGDIVQKAMQMRQNNPSNMMENKNRSPLQTSMSTPAAQAAVNQTGAQKTLEHMQNIGALGKPSTMKKGGAVKSASKRADGCAQRGKTRA